MNRLKVWGLRLAVLIMVGCACVAANVPVSPAAVEYCGANARCRAFPAFITGYTFYSNTPAKSAVVSHPILHEVAGGAGTWKDPITVAVGHSITDGKSRLDYPAGTRFYLPYLKKYFIVEDTCGDGPRPQDIACHTNKYGPEPWLDIWVNGEGLGSTKALRCAEGITGNREVVINPASNLPVTAGSVCD